MTPDTILIMGPVIKEQVQQLRTFQETT